MDQESITQSFSTHLKKAFAKAFDFALEFGHVEITNAHLLYGLAAEKGSLSSELLQKASFPVDLLKQELIRAHHQPFVPQAPSSPELSEEVITVLTKSARTAQLYAHTYIGTEHVLACLLNLANQDLRKLFHIWQLNMNDLEQQLLLVLKSTSKFPDLTETLRQLQVSQHEQEETGAEFPVLESLAKELTSPEFIEQAPPLIGREAELLRLQQLLLRRYKNNPLLVGIAGVGKTAIVEGFARAIMNGNVPPALLGKRVYHLELSSLVAGTMYRGEFEQRLKALVEECEQNPEIILFIDEIHTLIGAGSTGQALDAANILKPALARGSIRCIGATTWKEYYQYVNEDSALARRFQLIAVDEPTEDQTRSILSGAKGYLEEHHSVSLSDEAIEHALQLSKEHLPHAAWPDKALDLLDEASAQKKLHQRIVKEQAKRLELKKELETVQKEKQQALSDDLYDEALQLHERIEGLIQELKKTKPKKRKKTAVLQKDLVQALIDRTGMRTEQILFTPEQQFAGLEQRLQEQIHGQDEVIHKLSGFVRRAYSPLKDPRKPLGAFLFLGPSGTGKTTTAKHLAMELFQSERSLIRFDMSEYKERHSLSKLLGAPAGYIGHNKRGLLTEKLQQTPRSVVLFDEIEKAHPDIFNLLLQILDEGRLTDSSGTTIDFRQTLIILTSNLGMTQLQNRLGFGQQDSLTKEQIEQAVLSASKSFLRQELLNRLDDIHIFQPLGIQPRKAIIEKKLAALNHRLQEHLRISMDDATLEQFVQRAYSEQEGARSLLQYFTQTIEIPLQVALSEKQMHSIAEVKEKKGSFHLEFS